jgi:hypothetical protein
VFRKEVGKILKYKHLTIEIQSMWNANTVVIPINNGGSRNYLKIIQKMPEPHSGKARTQGTTDKSHIGHCTRTAGSANVKVQNILHVP